MARKGPVAKKEICPRWAYLFFDSNIMSQALILPQYPGDFSLSGHTHSQYLTSHQSLSSYATKTYVDNAVAGIDTSTVPSHTHNYAASNHTHSYASTSHTHSGYATDTHSHRASCSIVQFQSKSLANSNTISFEAESSNSAVGQYRWDGFILFPFIYSSSIQNNIDIQIGISQAIIGPYASSSSVYVKKDGTIYHGTITCTGDFGVNGKPASVTLPTVTSGVGIIVAAVGMQAKGNYVWPST